jgi:TldD protein
LELDEDAVVFAVDFARQSGCQYSEARYQRHTDMGCFLRNGEPQPAVIEDAEGIGIRILLDGALAFGATNLVSKESISELVERLVKNARVAAVGLKQKTAFSAEDSQTASWGVEEKKKLEDVRAESMISFLKEVNKSIPDAVSGVTFPNRNLVLYYSIDDKYFANSEGARLRGRVPRVTFYCMLVGLYNGKPSTVSVPPGYAGLGGTGGWEIMEELHLTSYVPAQLGEITNGIRATEKPPTGETLSVILGPGVAGLTSHESCGHPGEADRILGREGAQAGESFLKQDKLGMQIGSEEAFVSDDPTIPHSMGYYLYDEEGVKAKKRKLITAGKFTEFLQNRSTAPVFGVKSNGSSRAVQFDREPIIRMANTFIEPGDWTFEEMLRETKNGVYIKSFMEWNIDDKRLNQRYVGLEAYRIENGELKEAIKDPVLEITTPKYWGSIDARASDLQFTCGTCGKGDPMQGAPVFIGAPHVRLKDIAVGAR